MRFLQEMIAKKKHAREGHALAEAPPTASEDVSARDLHAAAFGDADLQPEGAAEPSILPYRVPVDGNEDDTALDAFRDQASASLNVKLNGTLAVDEDDSDVDDDIDTSALSYDETVGAQHAAEEEGRDELEYVDHFAAPKAATPKPAAEPAPKVEPEEELDPALASFFRKEAEAQVEPEPEPEPEDLPEVVAASTEPEPTDVAPVEEPAPVSVFNLDPAPEPEAAPEPVAEAPRPASQPVAAVAEDDAQDEVPLHPALANTANETPPDASLFFDKPPEDRLMERTNEIFASSTQAEAAADAAINGAAAGKKIWDLGVPGADPEADPSEAPQPQPRRRASRVKTRLLGFNRAEDAAPDPFASNASPQNGHSMFPVGWIIVVKGPGRGACFTLFSGASKIGRGEGQPIRLNFGDTSISRDNHAAVAYDDEQRMFFLGHGGKANLVRLNDMPVLSTEPLNDGDLIRIGETTLRFVALCDEEFAWPDTEDAEGADAQTG